MTQADEDDEIDLSGPGIEEEIGDDVEDIAAEVDAADETGELVASDDDDDEGGEVAPRSKRVAAEPVAVEDVANIEARRHVREQLESDVEAFLRKGGKIVEVAEDVRADPPKKPESKYGTRSI
jgi:hypothetical protein